jgi:hypothetical protein
MGVKKKPKPVLFEKEELSTLYDDEWQGMPEYISEDKTPYQQIIVSFENREDVAAFSKLLGQTITPNTRSIYYPKVEIERLVNKLYTTEAKEEPKPEETSDDYEQQFPDLYNF